MPVSFQSAAHANLPALAAHLLGDVDFQTCLALQNRLVFEAGGRSDGQITLLVCEHPKTITIGRGGSRSHLHLSANELAARNLDVQWVNRGGGCLAHLPGQLAIYPIVPLEFHNFSVGEYLTRLHAGLLAALDEVGVRGQLLPNRHGVWGRSGQLVAMGVAVRNWVAYHGAFLNVGPALDLFRLIDTDPQSGTAMSSLVVERQKPVRITGVRAALVRHLATALGCDRYHLHTGHPLLARQPRSKRESAARAG